MCKIKRIVIDNFRGIEHMEVDCSNRLNVFIGANGAGKSSVLEVVRLFESWFVARMRSANGRGAVLQNSDIMVGKDYCKVQILLDNGEECTLFKKANLIRHDFDLKSDVKAMGCLADALIEHRNQDNAFPFPIVAYYGVNRAITDIPLKPKNKPKLEATDAYYGSVDGSACIKQFFSWFREQEDIENDEFRYNQSAFQPNRQLEAVREAIRNILPGYSNLRVSRKPLCLMLEKESVKLRFNQLSDGEKCYITLVADIARRMAMTAGSKNVMGGGVVMIDEVELHLHPLWQREVLSKLVSTFPNCQFFITTHSPLVLSEVNRNENDVFVPMIDGRACPYSHSTYGMTFTDILTSVFDVPSTHNSVIQSHIDAVWKMLNESDCSSSNYQNEMRWLQANLDANDTEFFHIRMEELKLKRDKR